VNTSPAQSNTWDNGYPSGGNYWSDYSGVDEYSGPYQNETGSDGIGDTPYIIDEKNCDRYPLITPFRSEIDTSSNI
jgi:nitrous oxidase accessory protein NosD